MIGAACAQKVTSQPPPLRQRWPRSQSYFWWIPGGGGVLDRDKYRIRTIIRGAPKVRPTGPTGCVRAGVLRAQYTGRNDPRTRPKRSLRAFLPRFRVIRARVVFF